MGLLTDQHRQVTRQGNRHIAAAQVPAACLHLLVLLLLALSPLPWPLISLPAPHSLPP